MNCIIMIGAGGHARVLVEALRSSGLAVEGFVTPTPEDAVGAMSGILRIGDDESLLARDPRGTLIVNGIGSVGDPKRRKVTFEKFRSGGFSFATIIHPAATVAADAIVAEGAQIMAGAVLQPGVRVGLNTIINTGAIVDHDVIIGNHVHIAPAACLAGHVTVGHETHVGAGATVIQNVRIGERDLIAAGAIVIDDIPEGATLLGVPARLKSSG
jgi:sugar O-acyltransferase (sialic acid O-acetyltransferase NeuD family)